VQMHPAGVASDSLGNSTLAPTRARALSASDDAFIAIRNGILRGDLAPGEPITETQVASSLGISRTPVREALRELEAQGLLVRRHRRLLVATLSSDEASDVHAVRVSLELLGIRQAMARNPSEILVPQLERSVSEMRYSIRNRDTTQALASARSFHNVIYYATRNEMLIRFLMQVYNRVDQFRFYNATEQSISRLRQTAVEHTLIIEAIREGDMAQAAAKMDSHLGAGHEFDTKSAQLGSSSPSGPGDGG